MRFLFYLDCICFVLFGGIFVLCLGFDVVLIFFLVGYWWAGVCLFVFCLVLFLGCCSFL